MLKQVLVSKNLATASKSSALNSVKLVISFWFRHFSNFNFLWLGEQSLVARFLDLKFIFFFLKKSRFFFIHQNSLKKEMTKKSLKWSSKNVNKVSPIFSNSNFQKFNWFLRFRKIFHKKSSKWCGLNAK